MTGKGQSANGKGQRAEGRGQNSRPGGRTLAEDSGVALVLTMLLVLATSIIASSLMFMGQTETFAGRNYRLMSQARYGAEAGVQAAANYFLWTYAPPTAGGADALGAYTYAATSPVTYNGKPVVLSANPAVKSNYPVDAVKAAFTAAAAGALAAGTTNVSYAPYATLIAMQQVVTYGGNTQTIQTWQIVSDGTITLAGSTAAQVEVSTVLETQAISTFRYAAFATSGQCAALDFKGKNTSTDSYSSTAALVAGAPATAISGGNIGTNGNLTEAGGATINGTLSTPKVGVGNCSAGNVDALTASGGATIQGYQQLSNAYTPPTPPSPNPMPPTTAYNGNGQTLLNGASVGDVTVNANSTLTLGAPGVTSTIVMNSLTVSGNANVVILGTVILEIGGQADGQNGGTVVSLTGNSITNASYNPANFQILYSGSNPMTVTGGSSTAMLVYAPNSAITLAGNGSPTPPNGLYGAVVGATVMDTGGTSIHYDRNLQNEFNTVGNTMQTAFSWKKY